jgi:hypothetical protein
MAYARVVVMLPSLRWLVESHKALQPSVKDAADCTQRFYFAETGPGGGFNDRKHGDNQACGSRILSHACHSAEAAHEKRTKTPHNFLCHGMH